MVASGTCDGAGFASSVQHGNTPAMRNSAYHGPGPWLYGILFNHLFGLSNMSTSRNILGILDSQTKDFLGYFPFYLDALDELFSLQSSIGLDGAAMQALPEDDQNAVKTYVFLVESANTTWAAALRLLSSGFVAESYSLIRVLYEIAALLHYANSSPPSTRAELYLTMFKSGLPEDQHRKEEWNLIRKASQLIEQENPGLVPVHRELNNFGGHISRAKVVLSNITVIGSSSASRIFTPNWKDNRYLAGLDFLFTVTVLILEEYTKVHETYGGITPDVQGKVRGHAAMALG